jgi:hypothetical protein
LKIRISIPELCDFIHQIVVDMPRCKLRTPWQIHFKFGIVIGIDILMVCLICGEISNFHSRAMGLF